MPHGFGQSRYLIGKGTREKEERGDRDRNEPIWRRFIRDEMSSKPIKRDMRRQHGQRAPRWEK